MRPRWKRWSGETGSDELPPGWTREQDEDGRTVYLMPGGQGKQYERPKSQENQSVRIQSIFPSGLVGAGLYYDKSTAARWVFFAKGWCSTQ